MITRWLALFLLISLSSTVQAFETFVVSDIRLQGLERIPDGTLLNYLPVRVGDPVDEQQAAYALRQLYKTGFFKDVVLERDGDVLVVKVKERPAIAEVKFDGNSDIEDEQLEDILKDIGIVKGRVFDPSALDKIEQGLKQQAYFAQGKYGVRIETKVTELERNRVSIDINISEGVIARIKQVNIVGNKVFDDDRLLGELQLGVPGAFGWFSSADEYAKPKLAADLETLKSYYQDRGYIKFTIESTQVSITPDKKDIYITINVNEGDKYTIKDIKLAGEMVVDEDELRKLLLVNAGDLFSRQKMIEDKDLLTRRLGNEGYAFAKVNVLPELDEENKQVSLTFFMEPGKKVYVRRIQFFGNYKTNDEVLRREMRLMEGSELVNTKLERSKIRLQRLSYVEEVSIDKVPVAGTDDLVDLEIKVTERLSGSFNIGAGFSQSQGFVFNLGLQMENLMGTGKRLGINFSNDDANQVYSLSFTDPYYTVDGISRTFNLSYRKRDFAEESTASFLTNVYGASVVFGVPLTEYDSIRLGIGYENTQVLRNAVSVSTQDVLLFLEQYGDDPLGTDGLHHEATISAMTLTASYTHDTRNRTVFASSGSSQSVYLDMTAPGSDIEYYKLSYRTKFYFDVSNDLTLLLNSDIAFGDGYGDNEVLPFFERFYAGGLRTVRGFDSNSLGPIDAGTLDPRGGDIRTVAGAELIFPVPFMEKSPRSVRLSAFYDIGNVFLKDEGGFDKDELRSSVGVSFVWLAPIGPLQFSWAVPIEEEPEDDIQNFQFSIGSFF